MVFFHVVRNARFGSSQQHAAKGQPSDVLKNIGVLDGFGRSFAPRKGRVTRNQHAGNGDGVEILTAKQPNDDCAGIAHVGLDPLRQQ